MVELGKALERAVGGGHPWIFRDALVGELPEPGEVVTVLDRKRRFLARGLAERGPIGVRVFTTEDRALDRELLAERLDSALDLRRRLAPPATDSLRLVHGEGDRLPGVVVDRYAEHAVLRCDGEAIERWREPIEALLRERLPGLGVRTLLRRSGRGEHKRVEPVFGRLPTEAIEIREHGMRLLVDLVRGQKTGMFLDHRQNRARVRELVAGLGEAGYAPRVANLFGYTGGFSIAAGLGGAAKVVTVDVAAPALALADRAWPLNELEPGRHYGAAAPVERWLAEQRGQFELVVADPPSFAPSRATRDRGLGAYRALHAAALPIVADGGLYLAASCSSQVDRAAFEDTLRKGARMARVELAVLERGGAGFDHPTPLGFPEGEYLVATLCRVLR
ncbi:Ribosomal RNA large subunit methyltransferase I [Enhygromyxa salina]|uniref:Ribosomal RNA large subunit methyltransferase I n=1 Tax=Enhygromyxa salina TaxID=215803 RepID=A0A2S9XBR5_9BACT|nr:class I SAM-dependent rRNA methyltransferase [Enhygromyxa salina]PRP90302.1 Ribosomal RNA large subunit methyltransferase I [Enhygromyxa salina]